MNFSRYTIKDKNEILKILESGESGLGDDEIRKRQERYGFNEIKSREIRTHDILIRQFKSSFFYLLFITTIIAFLIGESINGSLILVFALINVFLGFFQEYRAERAAKLLKTYFSQEVRVVRGGEEKIIDKNFLVPGDMVLLEAGNVVPADLRVLKEKNFVVDESIFTGESVPQSKTSNALPEEMTDFFRAKNIVFGGTSVVSGEAEGIVIKIGKDTALGGIAKLSAESPRQGIYERDLITFSKLILRIVVITILFIFIGNLIIKGTGNFFDFLIFCIALIVGIIPEALPLVVTFALSQGALKMARKKVVVRRLSSIEDLGNIEILCADKTGTLTENKLSLENIFSHHEKKCLLYGLLSSSYMEEEIESVRNPFDEAIFRKCPEAIRNNLGMFKIISEIPFDSRRLISSALLKDSEGGKILIVKGAPEVVLKLSSKLENGGNKNKIKEEIEKRGEEGKRVLAVAFKKLRKEKYSDSDENGLTFLGYFSFIDPLKESTEEAISLAKNLGVAIKILTGDTPEVAGQVAKKIGLVKDFKEVISGETLNSLSEKDFERKCFEFQVFARVSPETKFKIIETLQKKFEVGFLGEGINDAPALKIANVAIAVKGAADVSREASDIILLEKDLKVIVEGIKQGRNIFSNVNKYIKCTLASNFGNFYSIAAIALIIDFLPMLPVQILLANLLTDFPLIAIASDSIDVEDLRKPKFFKINQRIFLIFLLGFTSSIFDFIFFGFFRKIEPTLLQTLWFTFSIFTEIFLIFSVRTYHFFLRAKKPSRILTGLVALTFILTLILPFTNLGKEFFHFSSPPIPFLIIVIFFALMYFFASEVVKLTYFYYQKKKDHLAARLQP